jgi:hypothetical protein
VLLICFSYLLLWEWSTGSSGWLLSLALWKGWLDPGAGVAASNFTLALIDVQLGAPKSTPRSNKGTDTPDACWFPGRMPAIGGIPAPHSHPGDPITPQMRIWLAVESVDFHREQGDVLPVSAVLGLKNACQLRKNHQNQQIEKKLGPIHHIKMAPGAVPKQRAGGAQTELNHKLFPCKFGE